MNHARIEKVAGIVGWVTLGFGAALTLAPARSTTALALGNRPVLGAVVGPADLVIGSGVLWARRRWPWMAARAALNLTLVGCYRAEAGRPGGDSNARGAAVAMAALTVVDTALTVALATRRH